MPHMVLRSLSCRRVEDSFHKHLQITSQQCILLSLSEASVFEQRNVLEAENASGNYRASELLLMVKCSISVTAVDG